MQTNLQQVDVNKFTFQLDDAEAINHIVVFLLGTIPFQQGFAATVHLLWPNKTWQLLGMYVSSLSSFFNVVFALCSRFNCPLYSYFTYSHTFYLFFSHLCLSRE